MASAALLMTLLAAAQAPLDTGAVARLTFIDLAGRAVHTTDLRGKIVLIDVWASWCAPCLADLPLLRQLQRDHANDLAIVGISLDRMARRDFVSWLRRHDVSWPQYFDGRGYASPAARALGVEALPATLLIARDGSIAGWNLRGSALSARIRDLITASGGARGGGGR